MATNDYSSPQQQQLHDNGQQTHEHEDIKVCYSAPNTPPAQLTDGQISEGKVVTPFVTVVRIFQTEIIDKSGVSMLFTI
jgi:hypothetical protein